MPTVLWDRLLETCFKQQADVALLAPGSPPMLLIEGCWRSLSVAPLEPEDVESMARGLLSPKPEAELDGYAYRGFWYGNVAFFCAMAFGFPGTRLLVVSPAAPTRPPPADPRHPDADA